MVVENPLNSLKLTSIVSQNGVVFRCQVMLQSISLDCALKLLQEVDAVLNALRLTEVIVDEGLKLGVQLGNGNVEGHVLLIEGAVR